MNEIKNINIWDTQYKDKTIHFNDIDEFINYLEQENKYLYDISEKHMPHEPINLILDKVSTNQNICITYTDNSHQVTIIDFGFLGKEIIIHPSFYEKHKDKLMEYSKKKVLECIEEQKSITYIPDNIINDVLINKITSSENLINTTFIISKIIDKKLNAEQIKKIKNAHLELSYGNEKISTNKLISYYTILDLKKLKNLRINSNHPLNEVENFIYLNDDCEINIIALSKEDEYLYINNLKNIINILSKHNKKYNIKIQIDNRELLKQSNILNTPNINYIINNDLHDYHKEEYLNEEAQLEKLIEPIKKANLSPYEKYLAVYNIVKQFKPYKENQDDKNQSRYLRYILNNNYIVCVGYAKLLKTLLEKVGIPCIITSVGIDISYDDGFTLEDKETQIEGHERNIIKIDDDKYNIHGIYIADSTWDNNMEYDLYNNSSMTFDKKKEAKRLEKLSNKDLVLDFHDFNEFSQKINYYLKREINKKTYKDINTCIMRAYNELYDDIMTILAKLDYQKFKELENKYSQLIKDNEGKIANLEQIYSNFLTDYAMYILPLSNKTIDKTILLEAAVNTKKELYKYNKEELERLKTVITSNYETLEEISFPYQYNSNNKIEGYLETKNKSK